MKDVRPQTVANEQMPAAVGTTPAAEHAAHEPLEEPPDGIDLSLDGVDAYSADGWTIWPAG